MVEKGVLLFFSLCKCAEDFFKKPIYLVYHCCVYKSYSIILSYKVFNLQSKQSKFFTQNIIGSELYIIQLQMCNILWIGAYFVSAVCLKVLIILCVLAWLADRDFMGKGVFI